MRRLSLYFVGFLLLGGFGIFSFVSRGNVVKVSVIVPVYNSSEYLEDCLDSLSKQTLKGIEILLIDDGSTDGSAKILDKWAKKYRQFKVFHEPHQGVGFARNRGIVEAKGEYIGFVDSDDKVNKYYFSELYRMAKRYSAEIAATPNVLLMGESKGQFITGINPAMMTVSGSLLYQKMGGGAQWNKIYRADFLKRYQIKSTLYPSKVEDVYFTTLALMYTKKIAVSSQSIYYYRIKLPSAKHQPDFGRIYVYRDLLNHIKTADMSMTDRDFWYQEVLNKRFKDVFSEFSELDTEKDKQSFEALYHDVFHENIIDK